MYLLCRRQGSVIFFNTITLTSRRTMSINRRRRPTNDHQSNLRLNGLKIALFSIAFEKMKLAVTLLTLCCLYVSLSQQQQQYMARRYPLPFYYNSYYDDSSPQLLSRNHLMMGRQQAAPFFVVRNNYIQPYSSPSPPTPSFEDQNLMVILNGQP